MTESRWGLDAMWEAYHGIRHAHREAGYGKAFEDFEDLGLWSFIVRVDRHYRRPLPTPGLACPEHGLQEEDMTTRPSRDDGSLGPEDFSGWPGTPPSERLQAATEAVQIHSILGNEKEMILRLKEENDPVGNDMEMVIATMRNSILVQEMDQDRLEYISREGDFSALDDLLLEHESDTDFCGCLVIDDSPDTVEQPWLLAFRHLFALSRDPDWIGLSPGLPHMKGLHVYAAESPTRPGKIGFFQGLPEKLILARRKAPLPVPEGEPQLLAEIAAWHGARSFRWMPSSAWMRGSDGSGVN